MALPYKENIPGPDGISIQQEDFLSDSYKSALCHKEKESKLNSMIFPQNMICIFQTLSSSRYDKHHSCRVIFNLAHISSQFKQKKQLYLKINSNLIKLSFETVLTGTTRHNNQNIEVFHHKTNNRTYPSRHQLSLLHSPSFFDIIFKQWNTRITWFYFG